jgi:hypothetical protein
MNLSTWVVRMQDKKHSRMLLAALAACIAASVLTPQVTGQTERITRPAVSESASPLQTIAPLRETGLMATGCFASHPAMGRFRQSC